MNSGLSRTELRLFSGYEDQSNSPISDELFFFSLLETSFFNMFVVRGKIKFHQGPDPLSSQNSLR